MVNPVSDSQVIRGGLVLSPERPVAEKRDIVVRAGKIADLTSPGAVSDDAMPAIDASDRLLIPGLSNAHTHAQGNLAKGSGDRWSLELLLNAFPWLSGRRTVEHHYLSALIGGAEMLRKGCTATYDLFGEFPAPTPDGVSAVAKAYADIGMRAVVAPMMADRSFYASIPGLAGAFPPALKAEIDRIRYAPHSESLAVCRAIARDWPFNRDRIRLALAPTIPHHCSDEFLVGCRDLAREFELGVQMHVAESRLQAVVAPMVHGRSAVGHLHRLGLLGPHFTAAHAV